MGAAGLPVGGVMFELAFMCSVVCAIEEAYDMMPTVATNHKASYWLLSPRSKGGRES